MTETIASLVAAHQVGTARPADTVARSFARIRAHGDPAVFISLRDEALVVAEAETLASKNPRECPLYGVPVAVKDNIDVQGLPTTAGCPAFAYEPSKDSTVVKRLKRAGAIVIGKTNLDQFATGLVGVRSPYGVPRNAISPNCIPGRSSSGSAVAVAAGLVPLALGTDTAGSGRVPASPQQYRRIKAQSWSNLDSGRGSGLPLAGLHLPLDLDHRRRLDCACRSGRYRFRRCLLPRASGRTDELFP